MTDRDSCFICGIELANDEPFQEFYEEYSGETLSPLCQDCYDTQVEDDPEWEDEDDA